MGEREGKGKEENEDHDRCKGGTEASSDLMAGCTDAIIKPEMLCKWQLKPEKKKIYFRKQRRRERLQEPTQFVFLKHQAGSPFSGSERKTSADGKVQTSL